MIGTEEAARCCLRCPLHSRQGPTNGTAPRPNREAHHSCLFDLETPLRVSPKSLFGKRFLWHKWRDKCCWPWVSSHRSDRKSNQNKIGHGLLPRDITIECYITDATNMIMEAGMVPKDTTVRFRGDTRVRREWEGKSQALNIPTMASRR